MRESTYFEPGRIRPQVVDGHAVITKVHVRDRPQPWSHFRDSVMHAPFELDCCLTQHRFQPASARSEFVLRTNQVGFVNGTQHVYSRASNEFVFQRDSSARSVRPPVDTSTSLSRAAPHHSAPVCRVTNLRCDFSLDYNSPILTGPQGE